MKIDHNKQRDVRLPPTALFYLDIITERKVQDFLHFYCPSSCYIISVSGEVRDTEPRDKDIGICEGSA